VTRFHKSVKICKRCYKRKSIKEFHVNNGNYDGRGSYCKECAAEVHAIWHRRTQEKKSKEGVDESA
jgi:superfamily II helicase